MRGNRAAVPWRCARIALLAFAACAAQQAVSAGANDGALLVDMREQIFPRPPVLSDAERRKILAGAVDDAATSINSVARGAFTASGRDEIVYLLQRGGPQASDPAAPQGVTLAVFRDDRLQARMDTDAGNFIQSSVDIDGDGIGELLLRADSYQMGIATTRLSLVSLAQGRVTVIASFPEARVDRCGDERFGGDVEAVVIRYRRASAAAKPDFAIDRYEGRCEHGEPPRADKFRPLAADP